MLTGLMPGPLIGLWPQSAVLNVVLFEAFLSRYPRSSGNAQFLTNEGRL